MLNLDKFKNILKDNGVTNMSEKDILDLRDRQDQMAEIFFDMWLTKLNANKKEL